MKFVNELVVNEANVLYFAHLWKTLFHYYKIKQQK